MLVMLILDWNIIMNWLFELYDRLPVFFLDWMNCSLVSVSLKESLYFSLQTDTSSVLEDAMEYIGFLHKQVKVWPFLLHSEFITVDILVIGFIYRKHTTWTLILCNPFLPFLTAAQCSISWNFSSSQNAGKHNMNTLTME